MGMVLGMGALRSLEVRDIGLNKRTKLTDTKADTDMHLIWTEGVNPVNESIYSLVLTSNIIVGKSHTKKEKCQQNGLINLVF